MLFTLIFLACEDSTGPDHNAPAPVPAKPAVTAGFQETPYVALDFDPTAMQFAPDGRLFVAAQTGALRVIGHGTLLTTPFLTVSVTATAERGLLGVAFDPEYAANGYVYIYYTYSGTGKNRVSRFTTDANDPNVADPNSEHVLLDGMAGAAGYHNGGAIHFGADGKLYVAVGDSHDSQNAQDLSVLEGKLLRINSDGTVPPDNPFVGDPSARGEIWALGLRNPFTFAVQPGTGKIHINDVGEDTWEEVNLGAAAANYGWPACEGACSDPSFEDPIHAYTHLDGNCAVTGGAFYDGTQFPSEYAGGYFFADFCGNWIRFLRADNTVADFATVEAGFVVDLKVGPDGALYYLSREAPAVYQISATGSGNTAPTAVAAATPTSGLAPLEVSVDASGSSDADGDSLVYSWDFGDGGAATGVTVSHTYQEDGPFVVTLTAEDGNGGVGTDTVLIQVGNAPTGSITLPEAGAMYEAGDTIEFAGEGSDVEDGVLGDSAFSWTVRFHHDDHTHPHVGPITNIRSGSFVIPTTGETSDNVWYRISLTLTDSIGLRTTITRDVLPVKSTFTLATDPAGLGLTLDGQPVITPDTVTGVVGIDRTLGAPLQQTVAGTTYEFISWSDGGAATHTVQTPASPTTYLASYRAVSGIVGYWTMDSASLLGDTLLDQSGAGNDGIISGAVLDAGVLDEALALDGNDYVTVADDPSLQPQQLTLAAWINPSGSGDRTIVNKRRSGYFDSYTLRLTSSGAPQFCLEPMDASHCLVGSVSTFPTGTWNHIAATWDGTTLRVYKNGVADPATATHTAVSEYGAFPVLLGAEDQNGTLSMFYSGGLDDVRIYQRALKDAEVHALYTGESQDTVAPTAPQDLTASDVQAEQLTLSWSPSTDNVGVTGYRVYRDGAFVASVGDLTYTDAGLTPSTAYTYEVTAIDGAGLESAPSAPLTVTTAEPPPPSTTLLTASFDTGTDSFAYLDDAFRSTAAPAYAAASHTATDGFSGGGLRVLLGAIDADDISGMSGGWRAGFSLAAPGDVTLSLRYKLTQTSEYESDEFSDVLVSVDGVLYGPGTADYVARLYGDGNGGTARTTGWQSAELILTGLAAGSHTVTLGGYNNQKTYLDEQTEILIDDVTIAIPDTDSDEDTEPPTAPQDLTASDVQAEQLTLSWSPSTDNVVVTGYRVYRDGAFVASVSELTYTDAGLTPSTAYTYEVTAIDGAGLESAPSAPLTVTTAEPPPPSTTLLTASFDTGTDGFVYLDDAFRGTAAPAYAAGSHSATDGFSGGGLRVLLGAIDADDISGMSGGWRAGFSLAESGDVTLSLRYKLTQTSEYESDEFSDVLVSVDGVLYGPATADYVARLYGDGNGGTARTTGWQLAELTLTGLAAGSHTVTLGGYNNQKTYLDEQTEILIDNVTITVP